MIISLFLYFTRVAAFLLSMSDDDDLFYDSCDYNGDENGDGNTRNIGTYGSAETGVKYHNGGSGDDDFFYDSCNYDGDENNDGNTRDTITHGSTDTGTVVHTTTVVEATTIFSMIFAIVKATRTVKATP